MRTLLTSPDAFSFELIIITYYFTVTDRFHREMKSRASV